MGGVREYAREMVREMIAADSPHRFHLYYSERDLPGLHAGAGGRVREEFLPAPHKLVWDHWALPRALRRDRPDVVWFPQNVISLGVRIPAVVSVMDLLYFRVPEHPRREYLWPDILYMRTMIPRSLRLARRVACISEWTLRDAERLLDIPRDKMRAIHLAPSRAFLARAAADAAEVRRRYRLDRPFFFYAGTRSVRKNIRCLFEAFARCHREIPHDLVLTGGGGHVVVEDRAEDVLDRHGLRNRVKVLGLIPQEDLVALYGEADAFVFPSRYEGFGLPPLEAMARGCPVISSTATSLVEVVGDAALTFDPDAPEALAQHLRAVAGDADLRARLRAAGLARAAGFSYARSARQLLDLLEEAAG